MIVASTRPTRSADHVAPWVARKAGAHEAFEVEVLDLRDWPLPFFQEHFGSLGDPADPSYSDPAVKRWVGKIAEADAYLVVTPEHNRSVPATLKNAFDSVFASSAFRNKPIAAVGYSTGVAGGSRAVEHLAQIAIAAEMAPMRSSLVVPSVLTAFAEGEPRDPMTAISLDVLLDDLAWWSSTLRRARDEGQLPLAVMRVQAALAAN